MHSLHINPSQGEATRIPVSIRSKHIEITLLDKTQTDANQIPTRDMGQPNGSPFPHHHTCSSESCGSFRDIDVGIATSLSFASGLTFFVSQVPGELKLDYVSLLFCPTWCVSRNAFSYGSFITAPIHSLPRIYQRSLGIGVLASIVTHYLLALRRSPKGFSTMSRPDCLRNHSRGSQALSQ